MIHCHADAPGIAEVVACIENEEAIPRPGAEGLRGSIARSVIGDDDKVRGACLGLQAAGTFQRGLTTVEAGENGSDAWRVGHFGRQGFRSQRI